MYSPGRLVRQSVAPMLMHADAFQAALLFRFGLVIHDSGGMATDRRCRCGRIEPDPLGDHSVGCGANDAGLLMRHNEPVAAIMAMAGEGGLVAQAGLRQHYPALRDPPRGVNRTYTPDLIIRHYPTWNDALVGDVVFGHFTCASYLRRGDEDPLATANQVAATKDAKVNRFLEELVQAERGYTPPVSERFVALSFETYGAAGKPSARLFRSLIAT